MAGNVLTRGRVVAGNVLNKAGLREDWYISKPAQQFHKANRT